MNVGSGKYHLAGPYCTYKVKTVLCLVEFSQGGGISENILTKVLRHLDDLKVYDNYRKDVITFALLVDKYVISFDLSFLEYICDEKHKWTVVFGVPYGTSLWQVRDAI